MELVTIGAERQQLASVWPPVLFTPPSIASLQAAATLCDDPFYFLATV